MELEGSNINIGDNPSTLHRDRWRMHYRSVGLHTGNVPYTVNIPYNKLYVRYTTIMCYAMTLSLHMRKRLYRNDRLKYRVNMTYTN
jgi:hypothetical protein